MSLPWQMKVSLCANKGPFFLGDLHWYVQCDKTFEYIRLLLCRLHYSLSYVSALINNWL